MSAEATVVRNYLDWLLSIPWGVKGIALGDRAVDDAVVDNIPGSQVPGEADGRRHLVELARKIRVEAPVDKRRAVHYVPGVTETQRRELARGRPDF